MQHNATHASLHGQYTVQFPEILNTWKSFATIQIVYVNHVGYYKGAADSQTRLVKQS